jgi:hypothetical protein
VLVAQPILRAMTAHAMVSQGDFPWSRTAVDDSPDVLLTPWRVICRSASGRQTSEDATGRSGRRDQRAATRKTDPRWPYALASEAQRLHFAGRSSRSTVRPVYGRTASGSYASTLIAAGQSVKTVQVRRGHASAMVTLDVHGHLRPDSEELTRAAVDAWLVAPADSVRTGEA